MISTKGWGLKEWLGFPGALVAFAIGVFTILRWGHGILPHSLAQEAMEEAEAVAEDFEQHLDARARYDEAMLDQMFDIAEAARHRTCIEEDIEHATCDRESEERRREYQEKKLERMRQLAEQAEARTKKNADD